MTRRRKPGTGNGTSEDTTVLAAASPPGTPRRTGGALPFLPRLLRREQAALYCGLGATTFDAEVAAGRAPRPVQLTPGVRGWDRHDLDEWIEELKAAHAPAINPWDDEP